MVSRVVCAACTDGCFVYYIFAHALVLLWACFLIPTVTTGCVNDLWLWISKFMKAAKKRNLVSKGKCVFSTRTISILGNVVSKGEMKQDPERLIPLQELPAPVDAKKSSWPIFILFLVG